MDEAPYAVDLSVLPRGGSRRRKSMQPRALLNNNGSLSLSASVPHQRRSFSAELSREMRDELINTPVRGREIAQQDLSGSPATDGNDGATTEPVPSPGNGYFTASANDQADNDEAEDAEGDSFLPPATPTGFVAYDPADPAFQTPFAAGPDSANDPSAALSPTTPFYLDQGHKLIQMTCPPKQTGKGLFDVDEGDGGEGGPGGQVARSGQVAEMSGVPSQSFRVRKMRGMDGALGKKIADARRRTLGVEGGWKPVVRSPLGRD